MERDGGGEICTHFIEKYFCENHLMLCVLNKALFTVVVLKVLTVRKWEKPVRRSLVDIPTPGKVFFFLIIELCHEMIKLPRGVETKCPVVCK